MDVPASVYVLALVVALIAGYFLFASFAFGAGYQPTPRSVVDRMLRLAELRPSDTLFDLGAGTGAIVFRAARVYRAHVVGVEVEPFRVLILRIRRALGPASDHVRIQWGDFFRLDFESATVVTVFLWPGAMHRLRSKFERELAPGARIVSYYHAVPGWVPEVHDTENRVYLYRWAGVERNPKGPDSPRADSPTPS